MYFLVLTRGYTLEKYLPPLLVLLVSGSIVDEVNVFVFGLCRSGD